MVVVLVVTVGGRPAAAHTALEASTPADGETVTAPVGVITLDFSAAVNIVQDGYEVLDPQGRVRRPDVIEQPAPDLIVLRFTTPMGGGAAGVRWTATASDGHVLDGSFSFTIDASAPTTSAARTTTVARTTMTTVPATVATIAETTPSSAAATTAATAATPPTLAAVTLEEFLGGDVASPRALTWTRVAQVLGTIASLLAVGWLAFVLVLDGPTARSLLSASTVAGVVVAAAAVLEAAAHAGLILGRGLGVISDPVALYDAIDGDYRIALSLRMIGGLVLATGAAALRPQLARAGVALAALGAAAVVLSFSFDGHTVSKGNRLVQLVADVVHVLTGAWWLAGVVALVWWAWRRWRTPPTDQSDDGFLLALLRFSALAAWALLALTLAGGVMTLGIIDGLGDLTGTAWGRVLLFKLAATTLAVAIGAYHRWRLIPAVRQHPDDPVVRERVTDALAAEACLLALTGVLAGVLVGSMI